MVSPSVVAAIFMIQKARVTSGSFFITERSMPAFTSVSNSDFSNVNHSWSADRRLALPE